MLVPWFLLVDLGEEAFAFLFSSWCWHTLDVLPHFVELPTFGAKVCSNPRMFKTWWGGGSKACSHNNMLSKDGSTIRWSQFLRDLDLFSKIKPFKLLKEPQFCISQGTIVAKRILIEFLIWDFFVSPGFACQRCRTFPVLYTKRVIGYWYARTPPLLVIDGNYSRLAHKRVIE